MQTHGPYILLGFSMGGVVAHTMATYLEQSGDRVPLVLAIDSRIRGRDTDNRAEDARILDHLLGNLQQAAITEGALVNDLIAPTTKSEGMSEKWSKVDVLLNRLFNQPVDGSVSSSPASPSPFAARFVALFQQHLQLLATHTPPLTFSGTVQVFLCRTPHKEEIEKEWRAVTQGVAFDLLPPDVQHNTVMYKPNIDYLVKRILAKITTL